VQRGSPGDLSIEFVPTVNDQALFGDPVKHPEGSWLCSRIGGRLVNRDDDTYLVTYEFIYSPPYKLKPEGVTGFPEAGLDVEGWQVVVVEHDKTTGQPYPVNEWIYEPAADGKRTIAVVDVYPKKNFASLPIG